MKFAKPKQIAAISFFTLLVLPGQLAAQDKQDHGCAGTDDYGPAHEQCWQMPWRRVGPLSHMPIPMTGSPSDQETPISRDSQWQLQDTLAPFDPAEPAADSSSKSSCGAAQPPQRCIPLGGACFGPRRPHCCPAPFPHHSLCSSRTGWGRCLMN
jgi:hypothetical protein